MLTASPRKHNPSIDPRYEFPIHPKLEFLSRTLKLANLALGYGTSGESAIVPGTYFE